MIFTIGSEKVARLTDLRRSAKAIIEELKTAKNQEDSRIILTTHGEPVAVLQEYTAYQKMLDLLIETQRQLQIAETRERLRQMSEGSIKSVPLRQVMAQRTSASTDRDGDNV